MNRIFVIMVVLAGVVAGLEIAASRLMAIPEIAHNGYFSCTTCHASPGGGGVLTAYGRDYSEEKLSTWHYDSEGSVLHGLVPTQDQILVGADARWVDLKMSDTTGFTHIFWRMQTDIEAGAHLGPVWLTGVMGTSPAGPFDDQSTKGNLIHRGYAIRGDLFKEHILVRAGLFTPRFGLMLSDHTAFMRDMIGVGSNTEQTQGEVTYLDDMFEAYLGMLVVDNSYDRKGLSKSGFNSGISAFLFGKQKVSLSILNTDLKTDTNETKMMAVGLSGVITFLPRVYGMFEIDRKSNVAQSSSTQTNTEAIANFYSLNFEAFKGFVPYLRYEYMDTDIVLPDTSSQRWGAGIIWYPRPHLELEARGFRWIQNAAHSTTDEADVVLHYYL